MWGGGGVSGVCRHRQDIARHRSMCHNTPEGSGDDASNLTSCVWPSLICHTAEEHHPMGWLLSKVQGVCVGGGGE